MANEIGLETSSRTRLIGLGVSLLYALMMSLVFECWTVQYTSHSPQPMHASCLAIILFIFGSSFSFERDQMTAENVEFNVSCTLDNVVCEQLFSEVCVVFADVLAHCFHPSREL